MAGIEIAHHPGHRIALAWAAMTQEFSIAARDHGTGIAQERLDGVAGRGCLPFVAVEGGDLQDDLRDFLLRGTGPVAVEGPQHPPQPCALLAGQARIGRNRATMQGGEESANRFDPVEALGIKRNDGDREGAAVDGAIEDLEMLSIAESEAEIRIRAVHPKVDAPGRGSCRASIAPQARRGIDQHNDTCVFLRKPEDRGIGRRDQRIDREIAIPTAAGYARSAVRGLHGQRPTLQNPHRRHHCDGAIPKPDRMPSTHPDARIPPKNAR